VNADTPGIPPRLCTKLMTEHDAQDTENAKEIDVIIALADGDAS
jgi:hypothetical protein